MQFTNRLSQLLQKETDKLFKDFLSDNPDLLKKYVDGGLVAIGAALGPINTFMRHLLIVQGLDPDTNPTEKRQALIQKAMDAVFQKHHDKDFEDDYDVSWVHNKFGAVKNKLNITEERFRTLTDLSMVDSPSTNLAKAKLDELVQTANPIAPEAAKRELPIGVSVDEAGVKTYSQNAIQVLQELAAKLKADMPNATQTLKEFAPKTDTKKSGIKTGKKKLNKKSGPGARVKRVPGVQPEDNGPSSLKVESDRKVRPPSNRTPGRDFVSTAKAKRAEIQAAEKAAKEADPVFQAEAKAKLARATELTNIMVQKGLVTNDDKARQDQIESMKNWSDNNFDALERVVTKYGPTKDAVAENKFKGSFRRVNR